MQIAGTRMPTWLGISYALSLIAIFAWPFTAFMSVFAFDAPDSARMSSTHATVGIALCNPILPLAGVLSSFLAYTGARKRLASILVGIALLPFAALALLLIWLPVMSLGILLGTKF